jgi:hypothetical protein
LRAGSTYNAVQRLHISITAVVATNSIKHLLTWICPYYGSARVNLRVLASAAGATIYHRSSARGSASG